MGKGAIVNKGVQLEVVLVRWWRHGGGRNPRFKAIPLWILQTKRRLRSFTEAVGTSFKDALCSKDKLASWEDYIGA